MRHPAGTGEKSNQCYVTGTDGKAGVRMLFLIRPDFGPVAQGGACEADALGVRVAFKYSCGVTTPSLLRS